MLRYILQVKQVIYLLENGNGTDGSVRAGGTITKQKNSGMDAA